MWADGGIILKFCCFISVAFNGLRNIEHKKTGTWLYKKFSLDSTNMRHMWQSVTIFINILGMVHTTKHFVNSPPEISFSLSQTTEISKYICWSL